MTYLLYKVDIYNGPNINIIAVYMICRNTIHTQKMLFTNYSQLINTLAMTGSVTLHLYLDSRRLISDKPDIDIVVAREEQAKQNIRKANSVLDFNAYPAGIYRLKKKAEKLKRILAKFSATKLPVSKQ